MRYIKPILFAAHTYSMFEAGRDYNRYIHSNDLSKYGIHGATVYVSMGYMLACPLLPLRFLTEEQDKKLSMKYREWREGTHKNKENK
jgi:hypothetical protein